MQKSKLQFLPHNAGEEDATKFIILTLLSIACILGILVASGVIYCLRHSSHHKLKEKLTSLGSDSGSDATTAYQVGTWFLAPSVCSFPWTLKSVIYCPPHVRECCFYLFIAEVGSPPLNNALLGLPPLIFPQKDCNSFLLLVINLVYSCSSL